MTLREEYEKRYKYGQYQSNDEDDIKGVYDIHYYIENYKEQVLQTINDIIDYFDFEKISIAMKALDWHWCGNLNTPTPSEIKEALLHHLFELFEDECNSISSGGFTVSYEVLPPEIDEPNDFIHCVLVKAYFAIEDFNSML